MTHPERFKMFLTVAKSRFEIAQRIANGTIRETSPNLAGVIIPSLCDSFLFLCTRVNRIASNAPAEIDAVGVNAEQFTNFMDDVRTLRNVAEHWGDVIRPKMPQSHSHLSNKGLKKVL
jgi:hypothetical protein